MTQPNRSNRYRRIARLLVVLIVAGVFFVLGRMSSHWTPPSKQTNEDALRAKVRELSEEIAASQGVKVAPEELEGLVTGYAKHLSHAQNQWSQVQIVPIGDNPGVSQSEWGQWPELPIKMRMQPPLGFDPLEDSSAERRNR
jgi:hypothetical protein